METLQKEIDDLKKEVAHLKEIITEDYDLSVQASKDLDISRKSPPSEFVDIDEL